MCSQWALRPCALTSLCEAVNLVWLWDLLVSCPVQARVVVCKVIDTLITLEWF